MSDDAKHHFEDVGIKIVTSCQFLGGVIGDTAGTNDFITKKASEWEHYVKLLSSIAVDEPQAAFIALTKSLQNEWTFLQRVTSGCGSQFEVIKSAPFSVFLPSLFSHVITPSDRLLFSLPACMGGLNIRIPTLSSENYHDSSRCASQLIISAIKGLCQFSLYDHDKFVSGARSDFYKAKCALETEPFSNIFDNTDHHTQRYLLHNQTSLSHWLTALPVMKDGFHLSANEFRNAICLRYMKPLLQLPSHCDGCGSPFSTSHTLDCRRGGLITQRHNEIRDLIPDLSSLVSSQTTKEPIVQEGSTS